MPVIPNFESEKLTEKKNTAISEKGNNKQNRNKNPESANKTGLPDEFYSKIIYNYLHTKGDLLLEILNKLFLKTKNPLLFPFRFRAKKIYKKQIKQYSSLIRNSVLFDEEYYLNNNPDLKNNVDDPALHYLLHGGFENRNPSEKFNSQKYLITNIDVLENAVNPLLHYILHGEKEGRNINVKNEVIQEASLSETRETSHAEAISLLDETEKTFFDAEYYNFLYPDVISSGLNALEHYAFYGKKEGRHFNPIDVNTITNASYRNELKAKHCITGQGKKTNNKNILVCAHQCPEHLAGAELSFFDIIKALSESSYQVFVCLPSFNETYVKELLAWVRKIFFVPYHFWDQDYINDYAVKTLEEIIFIEKIKLVYVNTIVIREPLVAARRKSIPCLTHIRELLIDDYHLIESIGLDKEKIIEEVCHTSDYLIANSQATAAFYNLNPNTYTIPNCVDTNKFKIQKKKENTRVRVAIISNNHPKKGINDFVRIAEICSRTAPNADFSVFGNKTPLIEDFILKQRIGKLSNNISFQGYFDSPESIYENTDIVLSTSLFTESFGRTVAEAMAAGKPVIAYDYGAIPELIKDGHNGFLVPHRDIQAAAAKITYLADKADLIKKMGMEGRMIIEKKYSFQVFKQKLDDTISHILEASPSYPLCKPLPETLPVNELIKHRVSVIVPNFNYGEFLKTRINSIIRQSLNAYEIIFLDDASTDNSIPIATSLLEKSSCSTKILSNSRNKGVYHQWVKGIHEAKGDYIWIAEADDNAHPFFLNSLLSRMLKDDSLMAYCQSEKIDTNGNVISGNYLHHTEALNKERWKTDYYETGLREVVDFLFFRNTIPNVSACLFKKEALLNSLQEIGKPSYVGDWFLYASLLQKGTISFIHQSLNQFRRHPESVTRSNEKSSDYLHEVASLKLFIAERYPIHQGQLEKMAYFLNKDFKIKNISKNTEEPEVKSILQKIKGISQKHLRLVFLTTNNGSHNGGSEQLWIQTAQKARQEGHDLMIIIKKWEPAPYFFKEFEQMGIKILFKGCFDFQEICEYNPDLFIISLGDQDEGTEWYKRCISNNIPYIIINQLTKAPEYWPVNKSKTPAVKEGYLNALRVFFTSHNNRNLMQDRLSCEITNYSILFQPYYINKGYQIPFPSVEKGYHLAIPARLLCIHKGQDLIIKLMARKKWKDRDIFINLYGQGPDEERLKTMVKEFGLKNISFHKPKWELPNPDLASIWKQNHALLLPSYMEGMPLVLMNAMMLARVPVVTDVGGHSEVIRDNIDGFIARYPDIDCLDEALERAWNRRSQWQAIGESAREQILKYLPDDPPAHLLAGLIKIVKQKSND